MNKIKLFFLVIILLVICGCKSSYGFEKEDFGEKDVLLGFWASGNTSQVLEDLQKMGYSGNKVSKEMVLKSTSQHKTGLEISRIKRKKYTIKVRGAPARVGTYQTYKYSELKDLFGLTEDEKNLKEGYFWEANMIIRTGDEKKDNSGEGTEYPMYLKAIFTGSDADKIDNEKTDDTENNLENGDINKKIGDTTTGAVDTVKALQKFYKWSKGLGEHPIENLIIDSQNAVLSFFDGIQIFINNIQTQVDYTAQDEKMLYSYTELDEDGKGEDISDVSTDETKKAIGNRDKYTKVGEYTENDKSVTYINVSNPDYTGSTKIPVMVADFCNVATGKIDFLDINFFTGDKTKKKIKLEGKTKTVLKHGKETVWYMVNNIVKIIIRIVIYLAAVILITILIWHGLHTVGRGASGTPISMKEHKEALNRFALSLLMLVSSVVVMAICIFGTQEFFRLMKVDESNELPVRINVEGAYSFSTTPTGYIRYMASTDNWQNCTSKVGYTFVYCIMTLLNVVVVAFMGARIFLMWFVSILGPIFAALSAINEQGINRYRSWVVLYLSLSAVPVIMCLLNRIMINAI